MQLLVDLVFQDSPEILSTVIDETTMGVAIS